MFRKVLIANRGEIAVRIIRACRDLGVGTVAVYSDVDSWAPFVALADEAYPLGGNTPAESYLDGGKLIAIARRAGCDAVHPGYGFLSERASFARAVRDAGLVFIGPTPETMEQMGDKVAARLVAQRCKVPVVPGLDRPLRPGEDAAVHARALGYPVLLKAAAGGGGRGMRVVHDDAALADAVVRASAEARAAFGDGSVYLEKYLARPRHVEVQVFGDQTGAVVALGERDCSIQRRHQKLIEEAPCPVLTPKARRRLHEAARALAAAVGYVGAGTCEFLLDGADCYFLEMNTRLQVEHPVTEWVTGLDLVVEQLRVAAGARLSFGARDAAVRGHALECRITAEDPFAGATVAESFLPSTGKVLAVKEPGGPGVRVDGAVGPGDVVSPFYDPLLAKVSTWGRDRAEALRRMRRALREYRIVGVRTSIPFHRWLLEHPAFVAGDVDVHFVEREFCPAAPRKQYRRLAALIAAALEQEEQARAAPLPPDDEPSRWSQAGVQEGLRGW